MLKWFKSLFAKPDHNISASWVAAPGLALTLDVLTGDLQYGNGQSTKLGADLSELSALGPSSTFDGEFYFSYPHHALLVTTIDGEIDSFSIDFFEGAPPAFTFNGRPINLSRSSVKADITALFGPAKSTHEEVVDGCHTTELEFQTPDGVLSEWSFEDGKLIYIDVAYFEDDFDEEESSEGAETSEDEDAPEEGTW